MPVAIAFLVGLGLIAFFASRAEAKEERPQISNLENDYQTAKTTTDYLFVLDVAEREERAGDLAKALELRKVALRLIGGSEGNSESPTFWIDALNAMPLFLQENMVIALEKGEPGRIRVVAAQIRNEGSSFPNANPSFADIADNMINVADILEAAAGGGNGATIVPPTPFQPAGFNQTVIDQLRQSNSISQILAFTNNLVEPANVPEQSKQNALSLLWARVSELAGVPFSARWVDFAKVANEATENAVMTNIRNNTIVPAVGTLRFFGFDDLAIMVEQAKASP